MSCYPLFLVSPPFPCKPPFNFTRSTWSGYFPVQAFLLTGKGALPYLIRVFYIMHVRVHVMSCYPFFLVSPPLTSPDQLDQITSLPSSLFAFSSHSPGDLEIFDHAPVTWPTQNSCESVSYWPQLFCFQTASLLCRRPASSRTCRVGIEYSYAPVPWCSLPFDTETAPSVEEHFPVPRCGSPVNEGISIDLPYVASYPTQLMQALGLL